MLSAAGPARLAVWGSPISHSRSPLLHAAAYAVLGLDWTYERREVDEAGFGAALAEPTPDRRGLSLTMPLKGVGYATARTHDRAAALTGAVNTLLFADGGPHGFNTDIGGLARALREEGVDEAPAARILGAGATATSAVLALRSLGVRRIEVVARRPDAVSRLTVLGAEVGATVTAVPFGAPAPESVPLTIATLPGGTALGDDARRLADAGGLLVDVVYGGWPTPLARAWGDAGHRAVSGLGMLLHQALLQVRVFVGGDPEAVLADEAAVLAAMRSALMGD